MQHGKKILTEVVTFIKLWSFTCPTYFLRQLFSYFLFVFAKMSIFSVKISNQVSSSYKSTKCKNVSLSSSCCYSYTSSVCLVNCRLRKICFLFVCSSNHVVKNWQKEYIFPLSLMFFLLDEYLLLHEFSFSHA